MEGIKDFMQLLIPDGDDLAFDLFKDNEYQKLNMALEYHYAGEELDNVKKAYLILDDMCANDLAHAVERIDELNAILSELHYDITYQIVE